MTPAMPIYTLTNIPELTGETFVWRKQLLYLIVSLFEQDDLLM